MNVISEYMAKELNAQMNREFLNERIYLALSAYFENLRLQGFARFMRKQADGEHGHAMKFYDYIHDRFGLAEMQTLEAVKGSPKTALDALEAAARVEEQTTGEIWQLYRHAEEESDYATCNFLRWFIEEQVEEEKTIDQWCFLVRQSPNSVTLLELDERLLED